MHYTHQNTVVLTRQILQSAPEMAENRTDDPASFGRWGGRAIKSLDHGARWPRLEFHVFDLTLNCTYCVLGPVT